MRKRDSKRLVERSYDLIAEAYLASKDAYDPGTYAPLEQLIAMLPGGAAVLDLGCGAGVPVSQRLAQQFTVTGVDISARQLELARGHVPTGHFIKADMTTVDFAPGAFDAVVSCYAIIHVPAAEQPALVRRIYSWLKPNGLFLATWTIRGWEETIDDWNGWGAPMWWSHLGADANLGMLRAPGFEIENADTRTTNNETWLWVLARKPNGEGGQAHPPMPGRTGSA
jgi:SAM-dependent methyltransferase